MKSHTDSAEFAEKYLVGGENNPQFPSFIEALERLREKKSTDGSPDFEVTINTLQLDGKENYHVNYYLEAKNSKAKENGLRYEWINGLNDQIHLVKEPLKEGQLQFVSIDEQTLACSKNTLSKMSAKLFSTHFSYFYCTRGTFAVRFNTFSRSFSGINCCRACGSSLKGQSHDHHNQIYWAHKLDKVHKQYIFRN